MTSSSSSDPIRFTQPHIDPFLPGCYANYEKQNKENQQQFQRRFPSQKLPITYWGRGTLSKCTRYLEKDKQQYPSSCQTTSSLGCPQRVEGAPNQQNVFVPGAGDRDLYRENIDTDSELRNLNRDASYCPERLYQPSDVRRPSVDSSGNCMQSIGEIGVVGIRQSIPNKNTPSSGNPHKCLSNQHLGGCQKETYMKGQQYASSQTDVDYQHRNKNYQVDPANYLPWENYTVINQTPQWKHLQQHPTYPILHYL